MVCGFCKIDGHTKNTCIDLINIHEQLFHQTAIQISDYFNTLNLTLLRMIFEKSIDDQFSFRQKRQLLRLPKKELLQQLINIYVHKIDIQLIETQSEPVTTIKNSISREEEVIILFQKYKDFREKMDKKTSSSSSFDWQKIPKNIKLYYCDENGMDPTCSICLDKCKNIVNTNCYHSYCLKCITESFKINTHCPNCRSIINSIYIEKSI